jgi:hypothetical protein
MRAGLLAKATTAAFLCIRVNSPRGRLPRGVAPAASAGIAARTDNEFIVEFGDTSVEFEPLSAHIVDQSTRP